MIGRKKELEVLANAYASDKPQNDFITIINGIIKI